MRMRNSICASVGLLLLALASEAFEPGHDKVCIPSADGQTFECRDKSDTSAPQATTKTVEPSATAQVSADTPRAETLAPPANKLPNYLMQNPAAMPSASPSASTPVEAAAPTEPPISNAAAITSADVAAQTESAVEPTPPVAPPPDSATTASAPALEQGDSAPPPQSSRASAEAPIVETPSIEQVPAVAEPAAQASLTTPANPSIATVPGASEFLSLPASHYTLVLASVRDAAALDGLLRAFDNQPGRLYLLKLGMPDGDWYSLCWSDFTDLDSARTARSSLPADAAISSGWPRRIGLLQKELAR